MRDISVLVLTYNHENYIEKCLNSILDQNFPYEFPIIVVDDCSTDNTIEILQTFERNLPNRINIVRNRYNHVSKGMAPAKQIMSRIETKFVAFCDGDDFWTDTRKLRKQFEIMNRDTNLSLCHTNFSLGIEHDGVLEIKKRSAEEIARSKSQRNASDLLLGNYIKQSTVLVRKDYVDLEFVYFSKSISGLDALIYLSVGMRGNFAFLDDVTTVHRIHGSSLFSSSSRNSRDNLKEEYLWYCAANLPSSELRNSFQRQVFEMQFRKLIRSFPIYSILRPIVRLFRQVRNLLKRNSKPISRLKSKTRPVE